MRHGCEKDYKEYINQLNEEEQEYIREFYENFYKNADRNDAFKYAKEYDESQRPKKTPPSKIEESFKKFGPKGTFDNLCLATGQKIADYIQEPERWRKILIQFYRQTNELKRLQRKEWRK